MSICNGYAGRRGKNPVGIFLHNDAGSQNASAAHYEQWLQTHDLNSGFAHAYVASDGTLIAEDDGNCAYHCGLTDGNVNYYSIEICQSLGDLSTFLDNEERALQLAAQKCEQYGITPSSSTIRLHQEVYATSCPHRSVEVHGGADETKAYFIDRINELINDGGKETNEPIIEGRETTMQCFYTVDGKGPVIYFDGMKFHPLSHQDEMTILNTIYKANNGKDIPCFSWSSKAPWHVRLKEAVERLLEKEKKQE